MRMLIVFIIAIVLSINIYCGSEKNKNKKNSIKKIDTVQVLTKKPPLFELLKKNSFQAKYIYSHLFLFQNLYPQQKEDAKKYYLEGTLGDIHSTDSLKVLHPTLNNYIDKVRGPSPLNPLTDYDDKWIFQNNSPIIIAEKNQETVFLITTFVSDIMYNELQLKTYQDRALKVVNEYLLKNIKFLYDNLNGEDIKYLGIGIIYTYKSFLEKSKLARTEYLCMVSSVDTLKLFSNGEITESELIKSSDFYLEDANELRKVIIIE